MKLASEYASGRLLIHLRGDLDHHSAREVLRDVEESMDRYLPKSCVLELSGLSFMDSSALAVFLRAKKRMEETGGRLCLLDPSPQCARVLSAAGMHRWIPIQASHGKERSRCL